MICTCTLVVPANFGPDAQDAEVDRDPLCPSHFDIQYSLDEIDRLTAETHRALSLVTWLTDHYVEALKAVDASDQDNVNYWRWKGEAVAYYSALNKLCELIGETPPDLLSAEWRHAHGIKS